MLAFLVPRLYRVKIVPTDARVFSRNDNFLIGISVTIVGWNGSLLESWRSQLSGLQGWGTYTPIDRSTELWLWRLNEKGCVEFRRSDRGSYSLFPVDDDLLLVKGGKVERWTGEEFLPVDAATTEELRARYPVLGEAEPDSSWSVRELDLWSNGTDDVRFGPFRVVAEHSEQRQGIFYEDIIDIRVIRRDTILCRAREGRAVWRAVDRARYEALFVGRGSEEGP